MSTINQSLKDERINKIKHEQFAVWYLLLFVIRQRGIVEHKENGYQIELVDKKK